MRWVSAFLIGGAMMVAGLVEPANAQAQPAQAQPTASPGLYTVIYFEVAPTGSRKTTGLLRQFAAATRKEDGNAELTVLREIGRPGRFALVEAWRDKAASDAHGAAMKALGDKLQPLFASPFEARQFVPLSTGAPVASDQAGAVYVLTHVDVFPAGKDEAAALVKTLAEDSRKDAGVLRFDATVWDGHPNHFHLIEVWSDRTARTAHVLTDHTKQFRAKVTPLEGAFYDERLFEMVRKTD
jgi:quinol monooxygenase YgiN